jgi:hypothetical protein
MKRTRYRSDLLLAAAGLLLAGCSVQCTTGNEAERVAKQIAPAIAERAGGPVEVTCPELAADKPSECQARAQTGETFTVEVKKGADGDWDWTTKGVAFGGAVAEKIAPLLSERAGVPVEVTCPAIVLGKTCQARAQTGETFPIEVKQGEGENFDWETKGVAFGKAVAENITRLYAEAHGLQLPGVTCPGIMVEGSAEPATCQARVQGVDVGFDIQTGPDGATSIPRRGFVVSELAAKLAIDEMAKLGIQAEVDCGPALRISVPNSQFTCTAMDAGGETRPLYYRVTSDDGAIEMQNQPFE